MRAPVHPRSHGEHSTRSPSSPYPPCEVSILARPFERALPWSQRKSRSAHQFQSSPSLSEGRYLGQAFLPHVHTMFQSSPALSSGRYVGQTAKQSATTPFQSSPALSDGRYRRSKRLLIEVCHASMGPRHFCRGIRRRRADDGLASGASMGPRHFCRGIGLMADLVAGDTGSLQWGHGISAVESNVAAFAAAFRRVASMGPRHFCRGIRAPLE